MSPTSYPVAVVTDGDEAAKAAQGIADGHPGGYILLMITENSYNDNVMPAWQLSDLIKREGYITRLPTTGERKALETGLDIMGIPRAMYGRGTPTPPAAAPPGPDTQPPAAGT